MSAKWSSDSLRSIQTQLTEGLVERDLTMRLALLASLTGEHLLLIGPPGTAKSLVARRLHLAFSGTYFERLLTRFTVPEELFGPLSIKGLEDDRYERLTQSYLPTASIAFLDEIFKANSAILNALLTLLNEREFDNGSKREKTPLMSVVGASNELPEGEELDALFDRFLLRLHVGLVSKDAFKALLKLRGNATPAIPEQARLTAEDLGAIQKGSASVEVPDEVMAMLCELREWCMAEKVPVSDRRWRKIVKLLQVSAFTNGRNSVSVWDCWLLQHCLWNEPEGQKKIYDWYAARVGASKGMDASRITKVVVEWERRLKADMESRSQMRDEEGRLLYLGEDKKATVDQLVQKKRGNQLVFLAPIGAVWLLSGYTEDRTNHGEGYTLDGFRHMLVPDPDDGDQYEFDKWPQKQAYLKNKANWLTEPGDLLPFMEPTRHKPAYVSKTLRDIEGIRATIKTYQSRLHTHIASLESDIRSHLWVSDDFIGPVSQSLQQTKRDVDALIGRVEKLQQGFEQLPQEIDKDADGGSDA